MSRVDLLAPPPIYTAPQTFGLPTAWHCIDRRNAGWSEADSNVRMNAICLILLHLIALFMQWKCAVTYFEGFVRNLAVFRSVYTRYSLRAKHGGHFRAFRAEFYCWRSDCLKLLVWIWISWIYVDHDVLLCESKLYESIVVVIGMEGMSLVRRNVHNLNSSVCR